MEKMPTDAKEIRRRYHKQWRARNRDKVQKYNTRFSGKDF
jgi:hypothetical protein